MPEVLHLPKRASAHAGDVMEEMFAVAEGQVIDIVHVDGVARVESELARQTRRLSSSQTRPAPPPV